ncbi:MAG: TIGR03663 family protein [Verrucomicrobia bacterium]|nr:TIGR03663 family protein [Verrucomicrobiota bacterium]
MQRAVIIVLWISVIVTGAWLRFEDLAKRPFHADEATGARITARRMESSGGQFDPKHYHGPLLADLAIPLCQLHGETRWQEMTKATLRTLPAIAGTLLLLVPLRWRRRYGDGPMLLASALLATSPLLVYYSRMFIHESLLVLFGMLALVVLTRQPRWGIPGIFIGLMFATKESFAISLIAWSGAGLLVAWENRMSLKREVLTAAWRQYRIPVSLSLLAAMVTASAIYTDGFRHPQGAVDALRTFFVYETVAGHDKSIAYYARLLALPEKSGGVWWFGTPVLVLALYAYLTTLRRRPQPLLGRSTIRFIAYAAAGHFLIYSCIAYKTPWLACLPWAHVCLLAGCALVGFSRCRPPLQTALAMLAGACLVTQFQQSRRATGRHASDERNPFAYVPTRGDIETLETWLEQLRQVVPGGTLEPIAVIGTDYWPLPWYLRSFDQIGYWPDPPQDLTKMPLVFALPDAAETVVTALEKSHAALPRGLRAGVPMWLLVRNDIWQKWMEPDQR